MMILLLLGLGLSFFTVGFIIYFTKSKDFDEDLGALLLAMAVIFGICVVISLSIIGYHDSTKEAYIDTMEARYEVLTYELENDIFENDNDIGKVELMNKIQDWNEDLARCKKMQDNLWTGIYYRQVYDQFKPIKLKGENSHD